MLKPLLPFLLCYFLAFPSSAMDDQISDSGKRMSFEVAAVHPDPNRESTTAPGYLLTSDDSYRYKNGLFHADCLLLVYIDFAYKYRPTAAQRLALLAQLPKWASSEAFVIDARMPVNATNAQVRLMMQSLLAQRFHLVMHFDERTVPVLALMLDKPGVLGPNLRPHNFGPSCFEDGSPSSADQSDHHMSDTVCQHFSLMPADDGQLKIASRDATMTSITNSLQGAGFLDRPLIDGTGLTGTYDITFTWTPDTETDLPGVNGSFLEALKIQLGLKLKPTKAPIRVLVVDHIEKPNDN